MIIGYTLPNAIEYIANGHKIHTICEDKKQRYKVGMNLQHSTGVRTKKMKIHIENLCTRIDNVFINPRDQTVSVNNRLLTEFEKQVFIFNDGFDTIEDFWKWFNVPANYRLIQWTKFKYGV